MYICRECKAEYKEKVEYCDCGNNTFDYVEDKNKVQAVNTKQSLTLEQKSELVSRIFFALCIILSIIVWSIPVGKTSDKKPTPTQQKPISTSTSIPSIDKIWDNTPAYQPKPKQEQVQQQNPLEKLRQEIPLTFTPAKDKKVAQAEVQKKNTESVKSKPNVQNSKQVQPKISKPVQPKTSHNITSPAPKLDKKPLYKEPQKPIYNPNSPTMLKYKNSLRSVLFSHLAVGSISGSGECSIQFAIDPNGKLINRKFSQESSNKALNDAVYYMLMSVPKFTPPPVEYDAQTIKMHFKIDNGNYEISIY